jgi:hypothetical protein
MVRLRDRGIRRISQLMGLQQRAKRGKREQRGKEGTLQKHNKRSLIKEAYQAAPPVSHGVVRIRVEHDDGKGQQVGAVGCRGGQGRRQLCEQSD